MKCDECQQDIQGTYYEKDGKNICEKDYEAQDLKLTVDHNIFTLT